VATTQPFFASFVVFLSTFFLIVFVALGGGTLEYLQKFLQCVKYLNSPLYCSLSASLSQFPGTVSTGIIFAFTYMCLHYLPPPPTPPATPTPTLTPTFPFYPLPLGRTCITLLFSDFVEEKNIKDNKKNTSFLLV
jgi:hypothetical protein